MNPCQEKKTGERKKFEGVPQTHNNWTVFLEKNTCLNSLLILPHVYVYCTRASSCNRIQVQWWWWSGLCLWTHSKQPLHHSISQVPGKTSQGESFYHWFIGRQGKGMKEMNSHEWTWCLTPSLFLSFSLSLSSLLGQQPLESPWFSLLSFPWN